VQLRIWNALALATLETPRFAPALLAYVPSFSVSYANALRMLEGQDAALGASSAATAAASALSNAYAAIKLWMLLADRYRPLESSQRVPTPDNGDQQNNTIRQVWNEVWPPFENVILSSIMSTESVSHLCIANICSYSHKSTISQLGQLFGDRMLIWSCSFLRRDPSYPWTLPLHT
jgi:hypothetical protein